MRVRSRIPRLSAPLYTEDMRWASAQEWSGPALGERRAERLGRGRTVSDALHLVSSDQRCIAVGVGPAQHQGRCGSGRRTGVLAMITGPTESVRSVVWSPDGVVLASGSLDNTVRLWR